MYIASIPNPTYETARESYSYPVIADYPDEITDIDDKNKKVRIRYEATNGEEFVIHKLTINFIDSFVMDDANVVESVVQGLDLYDPRIVLECKPVVK
jgi:hypothetical protein